MTYSPKHDNTRPVFIALCFCVLSVFCFMKAGIKPDYKWLLQLLFVIFATLAIQMLLKYVLTSFRYVCDDKSLYIYKSVGKRELLVGKLELTNSASYMMTEKEFLCSDENYNIKATYTHIQNYKAKDVYIYVTTLGETNYMIKLETDEGFAEYVNSKIDENLKGTNKNDEI